MEEVGLALPENLVEASELGPGLERYAEAFAELAEGRHWMGGGMGPAWPLPIAEMEIEAYARMHGYADDRETLIEFRTLVKAQDREWLRDYAERNSKK